MPQSSRVCHLSSVLEGRETIRKGGSTKDLIPAKNALTPTVKVAGFVMNNREPTAQRRRRVLKRLPAKCRTVLA